MLITVKCWQDKACISKQTLRTTVKRVPSLQDNACQCSAAHTNETLLKLKFDVMTYSLYRTNLASSGYHLLGPIRAALRGCWFTSAQELKKAVHAWLTAWPKIFFSESIRKLMQWCTKSTGKQRDYVENDINLSFLFVLK
jgi:hypothetical protein